MSAACSHQVGIAAVLLAAWGTPWAEDSRLREIRYDPGAVVTVPVQRGVVTHIVLDADETITDVASGLGSDCSKPEAAWCIAAQAGGRNVFVKPKSSAATANNLAVVTDKRSYAFRLVLVPDGVQLDAVYRLAMHAPAVAAVLLPPPQPTAALASQVTPPASVPAGEVVADRLRTAPEIVNSSYSIAEGQASDEIVPTLVFDDGRFTYLRLPGNQAIPAVFAVFGDGSETLVNTRMEGDLLVVDRVSRRLMLRAGSAVVAVWNDDFDVQGVPPLSGTTAPGVQRVLRAEASAAGPQTFKGAAK